MSNLSYRSYVKRELDRLQTAIDKDIDRLVEVMASYEAQHQDIYDRGCYGVVYLEAAKHVVIEINELI